MTLEVKTNESGLQKRRKKRGQAPICRVFRKIQHEDEDTVTIKGLYVILLTDN